MKIIYRFLISFLIFSIALILPLSFTLHKELNDLFKEVKVSINEGRDVSIVQDKFIKGLYGHFISISFYAFFLAFILSLFSSRRFLKPLKALYDGAEAVKKGNLDIKIPVYSEDEIGEVSRVFNEMLTNSRAKTRELQKKDLYVQTMMDALWVVDENDTVVDINPAFTKMFGYDRNEVIGLSIYDFLDEENAMIMKRELEFKRLKGEHSTYEISMTASNGSQIPVLITGAPIIRDGTVAGKIGIIKDFREQASLVKKLKESKDHLETIMNSIEDSILIIDSDYKIRNANTAALAKYGHNIIGKTCYGTSHRCPKPCWTEGDECPVKEVFASGKVWRTIHEHYDKKGNKFYEEIVASPIKDSAGTVTEALELLRDVTERMRYMDEINRKNRELTLLNSFASIINQSPTAEEMFTKVLDRLMDAFNMDGWGVLTLNEEDRMLTCSYQRGLPEEFVRGAGRIRLGDDIPGRVAVTREMMMTPDVSSDTRVSHSILKHSGMKGYCCIPIVGKERVFGVYCLFKFKEHAFTTEEERILKSTGEMIGLALENIRLFEKMKEMFETQKSRRVQQQRDLLDLSSKLASASDVDEVIRCTSSLIKDYLLSDAILFWEPRDNHSLALRYFYGLKPKTAVLSLDVLSPETYTVEKGTYTTVHDISTDERFYFPDDLKPFTSVLSVPVMVERSILGVFTILTRIPREYRDDEIHFLRIITSIFAVALERSQIYEKRINERSLAEAILNTISEGVCTVNTVGTIISANRSAARILEIPVSDLVNSNYREIFGQAVEEKTCPVAKALNGEEATAEYTFKKDNKEKAIFVSSLPLMDSSGKIYGAVQVFRDVTKERDVDRMKTELIRSVSHEFRTPLSAIVGLTEMIIDDEVESERAQRYLQTIYNEGQRLTELVSDLLNVSRIESGTEPIRYTEIDFSDLVESVKKIFEKSISSKQITFSAEVDPTITEFYGDRGKLSQLLANLIDNSIKYSDPGCIINLRVKRSGKYVIIELSDTGWGIPEVDIPHLIERFYRGRHGERTKGTGLGLALCKEIVKIHNGSIEIESRLKEGTTVTVVLPIRRLEDVQSNDN